MNTLEKEQIARMLAVVQEKHEHRLEGHNLDYKERCLDVALFLFQEYRKAGSLSIKVYAKERVKRFEDMSRNTEVTVSAMHTKVEKIMTMTEHQLVPNTLKTFHQESLALFSLQYAGFSKTHDGIEVQLVPLFSETDP